MFKKTTIKRNYSEDDLEKAIQCVLSGMKNIEASRRFKIPNESLRVKVLRRRLELENE